MDAWSRLSERACPICGDEGHCEIGPHGAVWCSSAHAEAPGGWDHLKLAGAAGQGLFTPEGFPESMSAAAQVEPSREDRDRRAVIIAGRERVELQRAARLVRRGQKGHPLALEYFREAGVPVADLEGGLPAGVLVLEDGEAEGYGKGPVVALCFAGADHKLVGIQVRPVTENGVDDEKRREVMLGRCFGGSLRIGQDFSQKVLVVAEDICDGLTIAALTRWTVWAAWSRRAALRVDLPAERLAQRAEWILYALTQDFDRPGAAREINGQLRDEDGALLQAVADKFPRLRVGWSLPVGERSGETCDTWRELFDRTDRERFQAVLCSSVAVEAAAKPGDGARSGARMVLPERILSNNNQERAVRALRELYAPDAVQPGRGWRLRYWDGQWWRFTGTHWVRLREEGLKADLRPWLNRFWTKSFDRQGNEQTPKPLNPSERAVSELVASMQTVCFVDAARMPAWLVEDFGEADGELLGEARPWERAIEAEDSREVGRPDPRELIPCRNGLLDVREWLAGRAVLLPHSELLFTGTCLPYEIPADLLQQVAADDDALQASIERLCPLWMEFLGIVSGGDPEWEECLAMVMGNCLLPAIVHEIIALLVGPSRAGKGTVLQALRWLVGKDNVGVSDMNQLTRPFHLHALVGKSVCLMPDADMGHTTDKVYAREQLLKISGGDPVFVDRKNLDALPQHELQCKIVIACNRMPNISDVSGALAGRFRVLPFEESFVGKERHEFKSKETMKREAVGRLLWALRGLRLVEKRGKIIQPKRGLQLLDEYSEYADPVGAFVRACLDVALVGEEGEKFVSCQTVVDRWKKYLEDNGIAGLEKKGVAWFGKELRTACPRVTRTQKQSGGARVHVYEGLSLKTAASPFDETPA